MKTSQLFVHIFHFFFILFSLSFLLTTTLLSHKFIDSTDVHFYFDAVWSPLLYRTRCWSMMPLMSTRSRSHSYLLRRLLLKPCVLTFVYRFVVIVNFCLLKCSFTFDCIFLRFIRLPFLIDNFEGLNTSGAKRREKHCTYHYSNSNILLSHFNEEKNHLMSVTSHNVCTHVSDNLKIFHYGQYLEYIKLTISSTRTTKGSRNIIHNFFFQLDMCK